MAEELLDQLAGEMYRFLADAAGKRNVSVNDLVKAMQSTPGAACSRDDCKKAVRRLIESGRCVYCFQGGVNYIQVAPPQTAAAV